MIWWGGELGLYLPNMLLSQFCHIVPDEVEKVITRMGHFSPMNPNVDERRIDADGHTYHAIYNYISHT